MKNLAVFFCLLFAGSAFARNDISIANAPSWLSKPAVDLARKPAKKDIGYGHYYTLYEQQVNLATQENYQHLVYEIVSDAGVQEASEIDISYVPEYQRLVFHQITIHRGGKKINALDLKKIKKLQNETDLSMFIYNGNCMAYLILDDIRKGDRIEYDYTIVGLNPVFNKYSERFDVVSAGTIITNYYISIKAPAGRKLNIKPFNNAPSARISQSGGTTTYEWLVKDLTPYDYDDNEPAWYKGYPQISVTEYTGWADVNSWALSLMDYNSVVTPAVKSKAAELNEKAKNDPSGFLKEAVRFVQDEVRYMGVEIGEYSHRPNSPDKVLKQRYGDCKDKSLLLCALARANNMEAYVALVNSTYSERISQFNPSPLAFNHAIAQISFGGQTYWIDPTISYQRGKIEKLYCPPYGKAMLVKGFQNNLVDIPAHDGGETTIKEEYQIAKSKNETSYLTVSTFYNGNAADNIRSMLNSGSRSQTEVSYLGYYKNAYRNIEMTDSLTLTDDEENNSIVVMEKYAIPNLWKDDSMAGLKLNIVTQGAYNNFTEIPYTDRKAPLFLKPCKVNYMVILNMPIKWNIGGVKDDRISNDLFTYTFLPRAIGKMITLDYQLEILKDYVPAERSEEYKKYHDIITNTASMQFSWDGENLPVAEEAEAPPPPVLRTPSITRGFNGVLFLGTLVMIVVAVYLCFRFSTITIPGRKYQEPKAIGGWFILLACGMIARPLIFLILFFSEDYFDFGTWEAYWWVGSGPGLTYKLALVLQVMVTITYFVGSIWLVILFFNRRDIFPKAFVFYCGSYLFCTTLTIVLIDKSLNNGSFLDDIHVFTMAWLILTVLVWAPYVLVSKRSKATFVFPLPEPETADEIPPVAEPVENNIQVVPQPTIDPYNSSENP